MRLVITFTKDPVFIPNVVDYIDIIEDDQIVRRSYEYYDSDVDSDYETGTEFESDTEAETVRQHKNNLQRVITVKNIRSKFERCSKPKPLKYEFYRALNTLNYKKRLFSKIKYLKVLIECGLDMKENKDGMTALHIASQSDVKEVVELLLSHGADINAKTIEDGSKPIHMAAEYGQIEIINILLSHGADINDKDYHDSTPLLIAIHNNQKETANILITLGAV